MNIYRRNFVCRCPANNALIVYGLAIHSPKMIRVEAINAAVESFKSEYHEALADELHKAFGGYQVITAHHHGVDIETQRGAA